MEMFCCPGKEVFKSSGQGELLGRSELGAWDESCVLDVDVRTLWKSSHANLTMCRANMRRYVFLALTSVYII